MEEQSQWLIGLLAFISLAGLLMIFLGIQYNSLNTASLAHFGGYSSTYYKEGPVVVMIAGIFIVALIFIALADSIVGAMREVLENF